MKKAKIVKTKKLINKNKKKNLASKKLMQLVFFNKKVIISMVFVLLFSIALGQMVPLIEGKIVNNLEISVPAHTFIYLGVLIASILLIEGVCIFIQAKIFGALGNKVANQIRLDAFQNINKLPLTEFETKPVGSILLKTTTYANEVGSFFGVYISSFAINVIKLISILGFMISLNIYFALIAIMTGSIIFVVIKLIGKVIKKRNTAFKQADMEKGELLYESIKGLRAIIANNRKMKNLDKLKGALTRTNITWHRFTVINELLNPLVEVLWNLALVGIYFFAFSLMKSGSVVEIGTIVAFLGYMAQATKPISETGVVFRNLAVTYGALDKIYDKETIALTTFNDKSSNNLEIDTNSPEIDMKNLSFVHKFKGLAVTNFNLKIPFGQKVLIVGKSGSGKSSLSKLLVGVYKQTEGEYLINSNPVHKLSDSCRAKYFGLLAKENFFFNDTFLNNIRIGSVNATDEECYQAAKTASLDKVAAKLKNGYNTMLSETSNILSDGEKMLVGFARIILQNPKILIFDEAIASLDTTEEKKFLRKLTKFCEDKTLIFIDVSNKENFSFDRIIKIEHGEIISDITNETISSENVDETIASENVDETIASEKIDEPLSSEKIDEIIQIEKIDEKI